MIRRARIYWIFVDDGGAFEVVPTGWSALAVLLTGWWAHANDVLWRWLGFQMLPIAFIVLASGFWPLQFAAVVCALFVWLVYFPLKVFEWRAVALRARGYHVEAEVVASSSKDALRKYALSHDAVVA